MLQPIPIHVSLLEQALQHLSSHAPSLPVHLSDKVVKINIHLLQLFSPHLAFLLQSAPCQTDTALVIPDMDSSTMGHLQNILAFGLTRLAREEVAGNFDIIESAGLLGIDMESIDIVEEKSFEEESKVKNKGQIKTGKVNKTENIENDAGIMLHESEAEYYVPQADIIQLINGEANREESEQSSRSNLSFKCDVCVKVNISEQEYKNHLESEHKDTTWFQCSFCFFKGLHRRYINIHISEAHTNTKGLFQCTKCDHTSSYISNLRQHILTKHEGMRYPCSECPFTGSERSSLNQHIKSLHQSIKFDCPLCDSAHKTRSNLKTRIRSKHEGIRYPCSDCPFTGSEPSSLNQHKKSMHQNIKFSCPVCETTHGTRSNLKIHINSKHEGIRYPCSKCSFTGSHHSSLKQHIKSLHQNVRVSCPFCDSTHGSGSNLKNHIKRKHENINI